MTTKEFIARIADGTYSKNDVIMQSEQFPDKEDLLWDLELADKVCLESTGKPQITDEAQITRISNAISWLSEEYEKDSHGKAEICKEPGEAVLPDEIANNPLAINMLEKFKEAGLLDSNYQPINGTTLPQLSDIAYNISDFCGFDTYYGTFEKLWGKKNLRTHKDKGSDKNQKYLNRKKIVKDILLPFAQEYKEKDKEKTKKHIPFR